jgi:hypothetical protein
MNENDVRKTTLVCNKLTNFAPWMLWLKLWHLQSQADRRGRGFPLSSRRLARFGRHPTVPSPTRSPSTLLNASLGFDIGVHSCWRAMDKIGPSCELVILAIVPDLASPWTEHGSQQSALAASSLIR